MKKIFSLLTLLLAIVTSNAYAGDVYTLSYATGSAVQTPEGSNFFTCGGNPSANYKGSIYDGVTFETALKMDSKGSISFTPTADGTLTIIQSTVKNGTNNFKLNGTTINQKSTDATNKTATYTEDITAGTVYTIKKGNSEAGIIYVKVEYTGTVKTQLTAPTFTFNNETGAVTIAQKESKDVYYTIDGTEPTTDKGTKYEAPFTVEDGTTVKAIAIGDNVSTINSKVSEYFALLKTVTIQKPTITDVNGTVAISCATPGTTFKYSVNGASYVDYAYPFTLTEDGTVKVQANRENCTSVESDEYNVEAVKCVKNKTITLDYDSFDGDNKKTTINGVDNALGFVIENSNSKAYQTMNNAVIINGVKHNAIKLSNGTKNTLTLPEGIKATRITMYSVVNYQDENKVTGWSDINGAQEYKSIPMGAYKDAKGNFATVPDVRVYSLDNASTITFTETGSQIGTVIVLDVIDENTTEITLSEKSGMGTFSSTTAYELPAGLTAYTATCDGSKVTLTKVEDGIVAANQGVVFSGKKNGQYTLTPSTKESTTDWTKNELKNTASKEYTTAADDQSTYVLIANNEGKGQFARLNGGQTIPVGKAYLTVEGNDAKTLSLSFGETNGINAVENNAEQNGAYYTLSGQKTMKPVKGLYIHNGKKYIAK